MSNDRKAKDRKASRLESATHVLQSLLQNGKSPLAHQFLRWKLWRYWDEVVGPSAAKHTLPVAYDRGRLVVWVSDSARLQEMTFMARHLIQRINEFIGRRWVTNIRFTLDRHSVPDPEKGDETARRYLSGEGDGGGETY